MQSGLGQTRQNAGFVQEQGPGFRIVGELGEKDLEGNRLAGADLGSVIELGGRALFDQGSDLVALVQQETGPDARRRDPRGVQVFLVARVHARPPTTTPLPARIPRKAGIGERVVNRPFYSKRRPPIAIGLITARADGRAKNFYCEPEFRACEISPAPGQPASGVLAPLRFHQIDRDLGAVVGDVERA